MYVVSRKQVLRQLLGEWRERKALAEAQADRVRAQAAEKAPYYQDLSSHISAILLEASRQALGDPLHAAEVAGQAVEKVRALRRDAEAALRAAGYTPEMLMPKYTCPLCKDTGFVGEPVHSYCRCIQRELLKRMYEQVGVEGQTFENFDLSLFPEEPLQGGKSQREIMAYLRAICERYAGQFPANPRRNMLLSGHTGLGKSFLLNCMAARVLERGYPVLRITAYRMLDAMRRYHRGMDEGEMDMMLEAELLIVDDLGTEPMMENVTIEYLFTLLNERQQARLPTLCATNLSLKELKSRYTERISSRLLDKDQTMILLFVGKDVRLRSRNA